MITKAKLKDDIEWLKQELKFITNQHYKLSTAHYRLLSYLKLREIITPAIAPELVIEKIKK